MYLGSRLALARLSERQPLIELRFLEAFSSMATRGQCKRAAVLAQGWYKAELMEWMDRIPLHCPKEDRTTGAGARSPTLGDTQDTALTGDRVRNGELPGQAVRALGRVSQPDRQPAGEGGLHPSGVRAVSTWTPRPSSHP